MKFIYINVKQATLKCSFFFIMTEYNVFIHYNVKNNLNVWEEEVSVIKNKIKMLYNVKETLLKWWKNAVASQVKVYNKKHYLKTYNEVWPLLKQLFNSLV